jgi:hypothetical protein
MNRCALSAVILFVLALYPVSSADCGSDTVDCAAHEAGYEWANSNSVESVDDCLGKSDSFVEGCQAYVAETQPDEPSEPASNENQKEEGRSIQESPPKDAIEQAE